MAVLMDGTHGPMIQHSATHEKGATKAAVALNVALAVQGQGWRGSPRGACRDW